MAFARNSAGLLARKAFLLALMRRTGFSAHDQLKLPWQHRQNRFESVHIADTYGGELARNGSSDDEHGVHVRTVCRALLKEE